MSAKVPSDPFIAVIGDLVGSRQIEDRAAAQETLVDALERLNEEYGQSIASRFLVTLGDEFQGLLRFDAPVDEIWWWYQREVPYATRFGFGFGHLASPLRQEALGMDGPCWNAARAAIERAEDEAMRLSLGIAEVPWASRRLSSILSLVDRTMRSWTATQLETVLLLAKAKSQQEVAAIRGVQKQTISASLEASSGLAVLETVEAVFSTARDQVILWSYVNLLDLWRRRYPTIESQPSKAGRKEVSQKRLTERKSVKNG